MKKLNSSVIIRILEKPFTSNVIKLGIVSRLQGLSVNSLKLGVRFLRCLDRLEEGYAEYTETQGKVKKCLKVVGMKKNLSICLVQEHVQVMKKHGAMLRSLEIKLNRLQSSVVKILRDKVDKEAEKLRLAKELDVVRGKFLTLLKRTKERVEKVASVSRGKLLKSLYNLKEKKECIRGYRRRGYDALKVR